MFFEFAFYLGFAEEAKKPPLSRSRPPWKRRHVKETKKVEDVKKDADKKVDDVKVDAAKKKVVNVKTDEAKKVDKRQEGRSQEGR